MLKLLLSSFLLLFLFSCSTTRVDTSKYVPDSNTGKGLMLVSISYQGSMSGYAIHYADSSFAIEDSIQFGAGMSLIPVPPTGDYSHLDRKGKLFAVEVPAGEYSIYKWMVYSGYATLKQNSPISIKFKVLPGKATYIGNFDFVQTDSFGLTVTGVEVNYSDQSIVDYSILATKFPNISEDDVILGIKTNQFVAGIGGESQASWDIPMYYFK